MIFDVNQCEREYDARYRCHANGLFPDPDHLVIRGIWVDPPFVNIHGIQGANRIDEFFSLEDVVVIVHPEKPIIEYSFFWDDDINFPADSDPTDHEKVWIEYDPESGEIVDVYAYFHRAILSTKEALADARKHSSRARINVQWGGHGSLPVGWETIPSEAISIKYMSINNPVKLKDMQERYQEHRISIRMPDHPLAKEWPKKFEGSWEDYSKFTKYIDLRKIIKKKKMVMKSRWSNAVIDQYFLDYQFFPKIAWPTDVP